MRPRWMLLALLAATGCQLAGASAPAPVPPARVGVVVIGDSITQAASAEIEAAFARRGVAVSVRAHTNDLFRDRMADATAAAAAHPAVVLVNLGTNDVRCAEANALGAEPCRYPQLHAADLGSDADALVALFAPGTCVVGVDPSSAPAAGTVWAARAAAGTVAAVAPWRAETDAHPRWTADEVGHLTAEGRERYAEFLEAQARRWC